MGTETQIIARSHLAYVGDRPYIRGSDLYACFDEGLRKTHPELTASMIKRMRLVREVEANGEWALATSASGNAAATMEWLDTNGEQHLAAFLETGPRISKRSPDLPSMIETLDCDEAFGGEVQTKDLASASDFMNAIIEGNKTLHQKTLRARGEDDSSIRLVYIEDLPNISCGQFRLTFEHIGVRTRGCRRYSLCRICSPAFKDEMKCCYGF